MLAKSTWLALLAATPTLSETIHSVVVYARHGDRTAKFYKGYNMTNLGATQVFETGGYYRQRYVEDGAPFQIANISSDKALSRQIWASAPDELVLYQTATNFLQGLYPPLGQLSEPLSIETLANGTGVQDPLDGYQFLLIHGEDRSDPDTIWLKGDEQCPAYAEAYDSYALSAEYANTLSLSASFYERFIPFLGDIMGAENVSYANAFDVFDLLNVGSIHNDSVADSLSSSDLAQLRYYADEWEWNHSFNASMPDRSIGAKAFSGGILEQMAAVVDKKASVKFSLRTSSYDNMMGFSGLMSLQEASPDFMALPGYASSFSFELFSDGTDTPFPANPREDLNVRFLFKNGTTDSDLTAFPLFGRTDLTMTYGDFVDSLGSLAIKDEGAWCEVCRSEQPFCRYSSEDQDSDANSSSATKSASSGMSNAAAGAVGAAVTLAVLALVGGLLWLVRRRRASRKNAAAKVAPVEKTGSDTASDSVV